MDSRVFEKSPQLAPLLVRLYETQNLYKLARDTNPLAKVELTGAVAALLEVPLTGREQELLTDVLTALMRQAERDLRQALAERLSAMSTVPLRIILQLANDEIEVARPILRKSPILSDLDLIYIIKSQGAEYWRAIAARGNLSPQIIDILADTKDAKTAVALSENERITLTTHAIAILAEMAKSDESLARPLLARSELPQSISQALYKQVGPALKSALHTDYGLQGKEIDIAFDDVFIEFVTAENSEFMPSVQMISAAERAAKTGVLSLHGMLETLQRGQIATFIAQFSRFTGIPVRRVHDFMRQPCPKGLAISCRAFGIQKSDFSRIYLLTNRMRSSDRIVNQQDMLDILSYFDKVKSDIAMRIVQREAGA